MSGLEVDTTGLIWTQPNVLRQGLSLELVLTDWLDWLTSKPQRLACLYPLLEDYRWLRLCSPFLA